MVLAESHREAECRGAFSPFLLACIKFPLNGESNRPLRALRLQPACAVDAGLNTVGDKIDVD